MNTIIRKNGRIQVVETVYETVKEMSKNPGYIRVEIIQANINNQLTEEFLSRKIVIRALATILDNSHKLIHK
jgi:hypothetical protein